MTKANKEERTRKRIHYYIEKSNALHKRYQNKIDTLRTRTNKIEEKIYALKNKEKAEFEKLNEKFKKERKS